MPVVIAGAGPVGLCLALELARRGIGSVVLEREPALPADLRASTFHPPTIEMLEGLGLAAPLLEGGLKVPAWQVRQHETGERAVFDLGVLAPDTRHPYRVQYEQSAFCREALAAAEKDPRIELRFGAALVDFTDGDGGVTVRYAGPAGEGTLQARYLAGTDGAGSSVRKRLGLPFQGHAYPETTVLATTDFPFEAHLAGLSPVNYVWIDGGNYSLLKLPGRWRVSLYPDVDEDVAGMDSPAVIEAKLQRIVPRPQPYEVLEHRPYRVQQRLATAYHSGHVALAGDAAHLNSPSGGMGMNGGIHDAFELAAALSAALGGEGPDALRRYDRRRRPVARDEILKQADRNRDRMRNLDPAWRRAEMQRLQAIAADPVQAREYLLASSMIAGLRRAAAIP